MKFANIHQPKTVDQININKSLIKELWKTGFFRSEELIFSDGIQYEILSRGIEIEDSSADFGAVILRNPVTGQKITGGVKIDVRSSDWRGEGSLLDPKYEGVVLHLVANTDTVLLRNGTEVLSCQLTPESWVLDFYSRIPLECGTRLTVMSSIERNELLSQQLDDRIKRKTSEILSTLSSVDGDWYECCYISLFRAIGGQNKGEFEKMARSVKYSFVSLHQNRVELVIAALLGEAGYLDFEANDQSVDEYTKTLQREFLASKTSDGIVPALYTWKPQRHRPSSAPAISLVRAAVLLCAQPDLFNLIIELDNIVDLRQHFLTEVPQYWTTHSAPNKGINGRSSSLTRTKFDNLILNFVIPLLYARSVLDGNEKFADRAYSYYELTKAEHYTKISKWFSKEWRPRTAFDSQALVQLVDMNCKKAGCVGCPLAVRELQRVYHIYSRQL